MSVQKQQPINLEDCVVYFQQNKKRRKPRKGEVSRSAKSMIVSEFFFSLFSNLFGENRKVEKMFQTLGLIGGRGIELMQSCAMVPELKSRAALDHGDFSLKGSMIGVPSCSGTGVCSCVLPTQASSRGHVASLAQVPFPAASSSSSLHPVLHSS